MPMCGRQGHSKKALTDEIDSAEAVLGEDLPSGAGWDWEWPQQAEHGVTQGSKSLRGVAAADAAGVLAKAGISAPVQGVLYGPVLTAECQKDRRGGLLAGQAGDDVDGFVAGSACDLAGAGDTGDLGEAWPVEIAGDLAASGQFACFDPPVALLDCSGNQAIRWRLVVRWRGLRLTQGRDQCRGEKRRRRRPRYRPSTAADSL